MSIVTVLSVRFTVLQLAALMLMLPAVVMNGAPIFTPSKMLSLTVIDTVSKVVMPVTAAATVVLVLRPTVPKLTAIVCFSPVTGPEGLVLSFLDIWFYSCLIVNGQLLVPNDSLSTVLQMVRVVAKVTHANS